MALEKKVTYQNNIYHPSSVHVRQKTSILEDGKEISFSYERWGVMCDEDYSDQDAQTIAVCDAVFTDAVKEAHAEWKATQTV